jgi:two-component system nitrogen regulation sensor histidine kinase NtrY
MSSASETERRPGFAWGKLAAWAKRANLANIGAFALAALAVLSGIATYIALTTRPPFGNAPGTIYWLLTVNLVALLALGALIAHRVITFWKRGRSGTAGARLHSQFVALFSALALAPAILMAIFAGAFIFVGVESWFSARVSAAINGSREVAEAYLAEHQQTLKADALAMASDLNRDAPFLANNGTRFQQLVEAQAMLRNLTEALVFDGNGRVLARSGLTVSLEYDPIQLTLLDRARQGEVILLTNQADDRVRALVKLDSLVDTFLFVGRFVDPKVLGHREKVAAAAAEYAELEGRQGRIQILLAGVFTGVVLLLLAAAVWVALRYADHLAQPIAALIDAAQRVREGDLTARVEDARGRNELGRLARVFNAMTRRLETQRADLVAANRELDQRRQFIEAVMAGVSSLIFGLNRDGEITVANEPAQALMEKPEAPLVGKPMTDLVPEIAPLLLAAKRRPGKAVDGQIELKIAGEADPRIMLVRVATERVGGETQGYVVTFDDVSELLSAQRKAAWSDVARRFAHEMKNPLTPIQLATDRLKRKYLREIQSDPDTFKACTETIVRHVADIGRMVDEFSAFARMPAPMMQAESLEDVARQVVFLHAQAHASMRIVCEIAPGGPYVLTCDRRQVSQALTNLVKNAVESIEGRLEEQGGDGPLGEITVRLTADDSDVSIGVEDNGRGLPQVDRRRLTEPYVTTRAKGTGLGLAIVKRIMEDHQGKLVLEDRPGGPGARVSLVFPRAEPGAAAAE